MNEKQLQRAIHETPTGLERVYDEKSKRILRFPRTRSAPRLCPSSSSASSKKPLTVASCPARISTSEPAHAATGTCQLLAHLPGSSRQEHIDSQFN